MKKLEKSGDKNVFTDLRDGHKYRYVKIGAQTWMAENLAYIPHVNPKMKQENGIWVNEYDGWDIAAAQATQNYKTYGCLYDWPTAMGLDSTWLDNTWNGSSRNRQGICPPGWHLPTDDEWKELEKFLGMPEQALHMINSNRSGKHLNYSPLPEYPPVGQFLKAGQGWSKAGTEAGRSGFNALPAGVRGQSNLCYFTNIGYRAHFWTASKAFADSIQFSDDPCNQVAWSRELANYSEDDYRPFKPITFGQSVRCVKNQPGTSVNRIVETVDRKNEKTFREISAMLPDTARASPNWTRYGGNPQITGFVSGKAPGNAPKILWSIKRGKAHDLFAISDGKIFLPSTDSFLYAIDAETGRELWRLKASLPVFGNLQITDTYPVLAVTKYDSLSEIFNILFVNYESGKVIWESESGVFHRDAINSDGVFFYTTNNNRVLAIDIKTKEVIWEKTIANSQADDFLATPGLFIYTGANLTPAGELAEGLSIFMIAADSRTGTEKWKFTNRAPFYASPAIAGNRVFQGFEDQYLYSIDLETGKKVWKVFMDGNLWDSPAVGYNMVYIGSRNDFFYALDAASGRLIWKKKYPCIGNRTHPVIADSLVVFGGRDSCLYAVDAFTGKDLWKYKLPGMLPFALPRGNHKQNIPTPIMLHIPTG
ncbi:MAG: PQQ-binding-like beta-propeller repeat protein [Bacteroidia bacterium]|nr:PQQ-binding-like beta-propeller repeat protein [Bacteroidia bacterium]